MRSVETGSSTPKYLLAEKAILDGVKEGRFPPGSRLPSDRDLARMLNVAPLTLGNAMRRLVDRGVLDRRPRVGTFVRASTQAPNVALLVFNEDRIEAGLQRDLLDQLQTEGGARGHHVRAMLMPRPYPPLSQLCEELRAMRVGAVGLLDFLNTDRGYVEALSRVAPCVLFNKGLAGLNLSCATPDMFVGARRIADYFTRRGRRSVAAGVFHIQHQRHIELAIALEAECLARGLTVDKRFWRERATFDRCEGAAWLAEISAAADRPDAVVICGGVVADDVRSWFQAHREICGPEMDLVSLRLASAARRHAADWAVLAYDDNEATMAAGRMLFDIVEGKQSPDDAKVVRIAPELILPGERRGAGSEGSG